MLKNTILLISLITAGTLTYSAFNTEKVEHIYVLDAMKFIPTWSSDSEYALACKQEQSDRVNEDDAKELEVSQISNLVDKALYKCAIEGYVGIPLNVGKALFESTAIPVRATIPYELAKSVLSSNNSTKPIRCSDYIEPLVLACPKLLKPYTKKIRQLDNP